MQTEAFLASWIKAQHGISRTPKFASWVTPNGALANEANAGLLAWIYHKHSGAGNAKYTCWGEFQMRYMLGDGHTSFVVGEKDYPKKPAHKGASCAGEVHGFSGSFQPGCSVMARMSSLLSEVPAAFAAGCCAWLLCQLLCGHRDGAGSHTQAATYLRSSVPAELQLTTLHLPGSLP